MKKLFLAVSALIFLLASCGPRIVYKKHIDIERITWNRFDVKTFKVDIKDISAAYDFYIAIRHHTEVPLNALEVSFILYTPSGEMRISEHEIILRDKEGKLLGEGMGDLWDIEYPARMGFEFTEAGTCTVEISSAMSKADLPGIMQVGLIVRKGSPGP
jgi:gliding motility-associated lipoprotein GldH